MRKTVKYVISALIVIAFMSPSLICLTVPLLVDGFFSIVTSGSMEPAIPVGSVTIFRKVNPEDVKVGDVIAFETGESRTVHRVIEKVVEDGSFYFKTKGDANEDPDQYIVRPEDVVGALMLTIPYYGYLIYFAGTPIGFALTVVINAIIITVIVVSVRKALNKNGGNNEAKRRCNGEGEQLVLFSQVFRLSETHTW